MRKKEKEGDLNIYSTKNLLSFPTKVNNYNNKKKTKYLECNCWVCKILDKISDADTLKYEAYNIVSETGDSLFSPMHERYHDDDDYRSIRNSGGKVFLSADLVDSFFQKVFKK